MSGTNRGAEGGGIVGGIRIGDEIGRGSFATVFVGFDAAGGKVAVKSVARNKLNRKLAENLESEIRILKDISHPNIVALVEIVKTETHIHLVMEFCRLGDLSAYIKRKGNVLPHGVSPLTHTQQQPSNALASPWGGINEAIVRHFLAMLASALETLRSLSLIHRDLKPQNLLLDPPPPGSPDVILQSPYMNAPPLVVPALPVLKLADFGFARALPQQSLASTLCGSPLYMAPEILRGDRYDAKVDLWSLGTILYECMTGRPPFKAQNHIDLLRKIDRGEGFIKFPGDDDGPASASGGRSGGTAAAAAAGVAGSKGFAVGTAPVASHLRRAMGPGTSVPTGGGYIPAGSLGASSPRFVGPAVSDGAAGKHGVRPCSDDLKDLARRLLKRNPVERMSFEEFFMHPAVVGAGPPPSVAATEREAVPAERDGKGGETSASTANTASMEAEAEQAEVATATNTLPSTSPLVNPLLPDPGSTPFPPLQQQHQLQTNSLLKGPMSPQSQLQQPQRMYNYIPGAISSASNTAAAAAATATDASVASSAPPPPTPSAITLEPDPARIFDDLVPPFAGYDLDPVNLFGDLLVAPSPHVPTSNVVAGGGANVSKPLAPASAYVTRAKMGLAGAAARGEEDGSSSISSLGSLELSDDLEEPAAATAVGAGGKGKKSGGVIPSAVKQIAEAIRGGAAGASGGGSASGGTGSGGAKNQRDKKVSGGAGLKSSLDDFVVVDADAKPTEVNWIAPSEHGGMSDAMRTEAGSSHVGTSGFEKKYGPGVDAAMSASPPQSPFGKRGQVVPPPPSGESLRGSRTSLDRAPAVGSAGSGFHEYGMRVFGSLRESAHHFLDTMAPAAQQPLLQQPSHHAHSMQTLSGDPVGTVTGGGAFHATPASSSPLPTPQWTPELQAEANLLTILNLSTLRGHALHSFADEAQRDLVLAVAMAQQQQHQVSEDFRESTDPVAVAPSSSGGGTQIASKSTAGTGSIPAVAGRGSVAVVAEETLALYLAALRLYQFGLESARALWSREQARLTRIAAVAGGAGTPPESLDASVCVDLKSLNASVQWMKDKFDDCLERAQEVRGVIGDTGTVGGEEGVGEVPGAGVSKVAARSVERMVYERCLDVCRAAAQAESAGSFQSAEVGYTHAVHLLEAILYAPPSSTAFQNSINGSLMLDASVDDASMSENDRVVIERFLASIGNRMARLKAATNLN
ncbi:hypothetical protein BC830DRAFT_1225209 [Chytriomyces sp. MP71]|nr:hypothetical protein BC830DRAFT_1225209 [Chytriomyces sp. MP71]